MTDGTARDAWLGNGDAWPRGTNPFGTAAQSVTECWSRVNKNDFRGPLPDAEAGYYVGWTVPVLIAAIDPDAEAKLDGLSKALVSGRYLTENAGGSTARPSRYWPPRPAG